MADGCDSVHPSALSLSPSAMPASTAALIAALSNPREADRESAIARLTVIGARAVDRLVQLASSSAPSTARAAALQTLERIADRRALTPALALAGDPDVEVALSAIGVARVFVRGRDGIIAVDRLTAIAVDRSRSSVVRAAALAALKDLGAATIAPLLKRLADDPLLQLAEPTAMRATLIASAKAPLAALLGIVEGIRQREQAAPRSERAEWTAVRGAAHELLAGRGSRIALYDLRETIERADQPLPREFITAVTRIGDATCLEAIAAAYAKGKDVWWKKNLTDAFRAIAKRERITRRHLVMKKIEKRWPAAMPALMAKG
jgi:HEAT repeat protein